MDGNNMNPGQQPGGNEQGYQPYGSSNDSVYQTDNNYQQFGATNSNYSQYQYNNNSYQNSYQTPYQEPPQMELEEPVKISEWLITYLIMMIPCVNIIMIFVWAFGKNEKKSKSNYFKAALIITGIILVLYFIIIFVIAAGVIGSGSLYYR